MIILSIISLVSSLVFNSYNAITALIKAYGYLAIFMLMVLESSSLPVPSEVVLPLAGFFAEKGILNFPLAFAAGVLGAVLGSMVDYVIGYLIGKDIVYKHLKFFHIKKESLDNFDAWFEKNGIAAVFLTRLVPVVRTVINFPAGFAKMPLKEFLGYSIAGMMIWDLVLMIFGFYLLSAKSAVTVLASISAFALMLYAIYKYATKIMKR